MTRRTITVLVMILAISAVLLVWLNIKFLGLSYKLTLDAVRDVLLSALQVVAIIALLGVIVLIIRWLWRTGEGTIILPFDYPKGDDKYYGKAISDSLKTELLRIFQIHRQEQVERPKPTLLMKLKILFRLHRQQDASYQPQFGESSKISTGRRRESIRETPKLSVTGRPKAEIRFNTHLSPTGDNLNPTFADVATVGIAGATVSVGRLLITIKQLWALRDPNFVISGSLQRFGSLMRLVAFRESKEKQIETWEVSYKIENDDEIPGAIKDLAFKIWQGISQTDARTWEGFKYFTEALEGYRQYNLSGRDEELERTFRNCLSATQAEKDYKATFELLYNLALAYFKKNDFARSEELCEHAIKAKGHPFSDPSAFAQLSDAFNLFGVSCARQDKMLEAEYAFRRAIKRNTSNLDAYVNLSNTLYHLGLSSEINPTIDKAIKCKLLDNELPTFLGDWYARMNLIEPAIATYQGVLEEDPNNVYASYRLGSLYGDSNRVDEAIVELQRAIDLAPKVSLSATKLSLICNELGLVYANKGNQERAVDLYRQSIELDPELANPHNNLGLIYSADNRFIEAASEFKRAIQLDPTLTLSYLNLAGTYDSLGEVENAIINYQRVIAANPSDAQAHDWLGGMYAGLGREEEAITEFQQAIKLDPRNAFTYSGLAYVYRDLKAYDEAIAAYKRSIELDPDLLASHIGLGGVYRRLGRYEEAITAYQNAIERSDISPLARASLAACHLKLGRVTEYTAQIKIARAITHDWAGEEYNHACFEALCGEVDNALKLLKVVLQKKYQTRDYVRRDADFELISNNPGFKDLVGDQS